MTIRYFSDYFSGMIVDIDLFKEYDTHEYGWFRILSVLLFLVSILNRFEDSIWPGSWVFVNGLVAFMSLWIVGELFLFHLPFPWIVLCDYVGLANMRPRCFKREMAPAEFLDISHIRIYLFLVKLCKVRMEDGMEWDKDHTDLDHNLQKIMKRWAIRGDSQ